MVYLRNWKLYTETLPGDCDCEKMFISRQTYEGFLITVYSMVEVTRYLLSIGVPEVLSNRFNQDILEEYFGQLRSLGRRIHLLGYQENIVRDRRTVMKITGNTSGRHEKNKRPWFHVNNEMLKKRQSKAQKDKQAESVDFAVEIENNPTCPVNCENYYC